MSEHPNLRQLRYRIAAIEARLMGTRYPPPDPPWPRFGLFWPWTRKARRG